VIPLILFVLLIFAILFSFACNRDVFSPAKFYHAALTVYFTDIFLSEQYGYVYAIYLGFIFAGMLMSLLEAYALSKRGAALVRPKPSRMVPARFVVILWALSVVPVLAECHLIHITGGLASLAMTIAHRVVEWRGLGPLLMLIKLIAPINLVYFAVGLAYRKRYPRLWWLLYGLHLSLFIVTASLLGGRGFVLGQILLMMVVYNYLRKPVKLRYAILAGAALVVIAAFLGTVRNNLTRLDSFDRLREMRGDTLNLRILSYGTSPLTVIFSHEFTDLQYGKTLLMGVANLAPRRIWPGKFDSGGVVLTRFWLGSRYTGYTNKSTGLVVEGVINFGYPLGLATAFLLLLLTIGAVVRYYVYFLNRIHTRGSRLPCVSLVVTYAYLGPMPGNSLYCEFSHEYSGLIVKLVLLSLVIFFLRLRLLPSHLFVGSRMPSDQE